MKLEFLTECSGILSNCSLQFCLFIFSIISPLCCAPELGSGGKRGGGEEGEIGIITLLRRLIHKR
jgi:hypothetical protein